MSEAMTLIFGPLAGPECTRASRRTWLIWVRMFPAAAACLVAMGTLWFWWMSQQIDPTHRPFVELRGALTTIEWLMVVFAMLMTPGTLAGSLAGEKERGSIGLLLTTRVGSADIVLGRLAGRLSQVAMILLSALPALLLIAALSGFGLAPTLTLVALPIALGFGAAGISLAASALSKRGRDALMLVYLIEVLVLISPSLEGMGLESAGLLSPLETIQPLTWGEQVGPALTTAGIWSAMGVLGLALASWRLRPSCLSEGGDSRARKRKRRVTWVPPMDDERPMLWKELHIEKVGTLGKAGRWIGGLLVAWLALGSLGLAGVAAWGYFRPAATEWADWASLQLSNWYGGTAILIGCLIQCAIGLRAAVTISSERERNTWDALLTSPLEGTEIVRGKLWGSLWALKWLVASALLAWTISFALGGMFWPEYVEQLLGVAIIGTFMSAVGVRTSLRSSTATRAMGVTIAAWCGAYLVALVVAWTIVVVGILICVFAWLYAISTGLTTFSSRPWFPTSFRLAADILFYAQFIAGAILIVVETRYRFDRVAGRMTGGTSAVAIDRLLHGVPMAPVALPSRKTQAKAVAVVEDLA